MKAFLLSLILSVSCSQTWAAQGSNTLNHTATSGSKLETQLSEDIYRSVPYEDTYEEQEAYQAQEEYTVDIPYQENETYYVDVPYQETEDYYESIPYTERESYLDTETYYENEYRCETVTEYEQVCRTERLCSREPGDQTCQMVEECGTNALGQPICKTRKVCQSGPDRENCQNKNVCDSVPRSREKCGYEQVSKTRSVTKYRDVTKYREERRTRTVTKYRQEARSRTVTKYRQETRTRTVTKYRTVTKCCVTRYRSEFDHTWTMDVKLILPTQATLLPQETEKFKVTLSGSEAKPEVSLEIVSSIYGYKVIRKDVTTRSALIELQLAPKYNQQTLGENLVGRVELTGDQEDSHNELIISDKGIVPRVTTLYRFRILEAQTKQVILEGEASSDRATQQQVSVPLSSELPTDVDYIVQISATRSGIVLDKSFSFSVNKTVEYTRWDPIEFGEKTIKNQKLIEQKEKTLLSFTDLGAHLKLVTEYKVTVLNKNGVELSSQLLNSKEVLDGKNNANITLDPTVMGLEEDLVVNLVVKRTGKRLESAVSFQLSLDRIFLRLEDLKNKKLVSGLGIQGQKSNAMLVFRDEIKDTAKVKTDYKLTITRHGGFLGLQKKVMATLSLTQDQMKDGQYTAYLSNLGITTSQLNDHLTANATIYLDLSVSRKNTVDKKVLATFRKSVELKIQ